MATARGAQNVAGDNYIYPSNSDDSDFEESFRTIPDDISEVFDPPPAIPSDIESETENVELNKADDTGDEPNCYRLQETPSYNYYGDAENEEDFQDGWYWAIYLTNEIQNLKWDHLLGNDKFFWTHAKKNLSISSMRCFLHLCLTPLRNLRIDMLHKKSN